jgi:predicted nuclease of restriction endonuclease-like (RecB) superfamily
LAVYTDRRRISGTMKNEFIKSEEYKNWLIGIKSTIRKAQIKASLSANSVLIGLYWDLGQKIVEKQKQSSWGDSLIERLAKDLKSEFPEITGFSRRNLYAIRQWYLFYSKKFEKVPQAVAQIPWGHNRLIVSKVKDIDQAIYYSQETVKNGWARDILELQIESRLFERKGKALTNFESTLPIPQSDLARETLKDPYIFNFLELEENAQEREIEKELTKRITEFILELGKGFAFVGRQYNTKLK